MRAIAIPHIAPICHVGLQHVPQLLSQRPAIPKQAQLGPHASDISVDSMEPFSPRALPLVSPAHAPRYIQLLLHDSRPRERCVVASTRKSQVIANSLLPHSATASRRNAAPPQLARAGLARCGVEGGEDIFRPQVDHGRFGGFSGRKLGLGTLLALTLDFLRLCHHLLILLQMLALFFL